MSNISEECIAAFKEGDMSALHAIYEETSTQIYNSILKLTRNEKDAEDIAHDVYIRAYEKRHQYNGSAAISTWLTRIAINLTLNTLKRSQNFRSKLQRLFFWNNENIHHDEDIKTESIDKDTLLQKIKPDFRVCLILKEIEDYSYEEISTHLNINIGTVKSRLNRAKAHLKDILIKEGTNE